MDSGVRFWRKGLEFGIQSVQLVRWLTLSIDCKGRYVRLAIGYNIWPGEINLSVVHLQSMPEALVIKKVTWERG